MCLSRLKFAYRVASHIELPVEPVVFPGKTRSFTQIASSESLTLFSHPDYTATSAIISCRGRALGLVEADLDLQIPDFADRTRFANEASEASLYRNISFADDLGWLPLRQCRELRSC